MPSKMCHPFFMDGKRERQGSAVQVDRGIQAMLMKDSVSNIHTQDVGASNMEVAGLVVTDKLVPFK